ncbi:MAG: 1-acyl-sn-glycerol-3-phosphate acyltransferase [Phycisphaerae bacterium]|nr:1-acyl-sn-glycerol-3-phosphate acyltransferase [Saprospiraceae bacterium]
MKKLRAMLRLLYFAFYTSFKVGQIILSSLIMGQDIRRSMRIRQRWAQHLLSVIGVRVQTSGTPPDFPCILMSNHRSYLDPAILVRETNAYGVSKAEVAKWPIIGIGAKGAGVIFLKRESKESRKRTLQGIGEKLQEGFPVLLFPEGTTHSEPFTASFKPGGFKLAAAEGFPVVPVAIDYASTADHWIGNDTFLPHFLRRFGEREIPVQVHYGEAIWSDDPQVLLNDAKIWIDAELLDIASSFKLSSSKHQSQS